MDVKAAGEMTRHDLGEGIDKLDRLKDILRADDRILIAFSGGLDSSFLAAVAAGVLGEGVLLVTLDSAAIPRSELREAVEIARSLGLRHRVVPFEILEAEGVADNPPHRCALCKRAASRLLKRIAAEAGINRVADGVNLSDYGEYRPGIGASDEEGLIHPLAEAGMTKSDIRLLAKEMGLPFSDKPATACLATRVPYGEAITPEKLRMAEEAEDLIRGLGISGARVRVHGPMARIEVPSADLERALSRRIEIAGGLKKIGFSYVALDLEGYRPGRMDEALGRAPSLRSPGST
jgi:uncharacterized protein